MTRVRPAQVLRAVRTADRKVSEEWWRFLRSAGQMRTGSARCEVRSLALHCIMFGGQDQTHSLAQPSSRSARTTLRYVDSTLPSASTAPPRGGHVAHVERPAVFHRDGALNGALSVVGTEWRTEWRTECDGALNHQAAALPGLTSPH